MCLFRGWAQDTMYYVGVEAISPNRRGNFGHISKSVVKYRKYLACGLYSEPYFIGRWQGGSVAEYLACWTQAQKGLGSNRSGDAVG